MKPKACIVDIDGVICDASSRQNKYFDSAALKRGDCHSFTLSIIEYSKTTEGDLPIPPGLFMVHMWRSTCPLSPVIYLTSRNKSSRDLTQAWLEEFSLFRPGDLLIMSDDHVKDKNGRYSTHHHAPDYKRGEALRLMEEYDIIFAIDDNAETCRMYRDLGIPAIQALWPNVDCLSAMGEPNE